MCRFNEQLDNYGEQAAQVLARRTTPKGRWIAYAAAAGASLTAAASSEAGVIIYSGVQNKTITHTAGPGSTRIGIDMDLQDANTLADFQIKLSWIEQSIGGSQVTSAFARLGPATGTIAKANATANKVLYTTDSFSIPNDGVTSRQVVRKLAEGQWISSGAAQGFTNASRGLRSVVPRTAGFEESITSAVFGGWARNANTDTGFAGVEFQKDGNTHYGWIRLQVKKDFLGLPTQITAVDWAYQTEAGMGIGAGAVPEPSTAALMLLAAGAAGVVALRKKRASG